MCPTSLLPSTPGGEGVLRMVSEELLAPAGQGNKETQDITVRGSQKQLVSSAVAGNTSQEPWSCAVITTQPLGGLESQS